MTVFYKSEVSNDPHLLFHDYERKKVATILLDALYDYMGCTIVLVSEGGKYIRLLGKTCLITTINRMSDLFNLPYLYLSVNCNGGRQMIIARIFNHIAQRLNIKLHMNDHLNLNFDEMCSILKDLVHDYNREIVIFLGNAELIDPSELNYVGGILNPLGVSIIATCNLQINHDRYTQLSNIDTVLFIRPPTRKQLVIIYRKQAEILNLILPEDFIEYIIDMQYKYRIFDRSFGLEILDRLKAIQEERVLDVWECINITVEYAQQFRNPISFHSNEIQFDSIKDYEFIEVFFNHLFAYFLGSNTHCYITIEKLFEIFRVSSENVEIEYNEEKLNGLITLLQDIGFLYPINRGKSKGFEEKFFIGWKKHTIKKFTEIFFKSTPINDEKLSAEDQLNLIDQKKRKSTELISGIKSIRLNIKNIISIKNLAQISHKLGISVEEIIQKGKTMNYNIEKIITDDISLYLIVEKLKKRAPICKFIKKNGQRCLNRTRHPSGFCYHHR